MNDFFTTEALRAALGSAAPSRVLAEAVTDSTNAAARRAFVAGLDTPALFAAAEQTAGRGRLGRQFLSPAGTGVYFSYFQPLAASPESVLRSGAAFWLQPAATPASSGSTICGLARGRSAAFWQRRRSWGTGSV